MAHSGANDAENGENGNDMIQYQFKVDRQTWQDWKTTVPRTKKLDTRLIELIEDDTHTND